MKPSVLILAIVLLAWNHSFPQSKPGARQVALAHSNISFDNDAFSLFNNSSGLSLVGSREIGFYFSPSPFGIKELSNAYGVYCEPTKFGSLGAGFSTYGFELYRETSIIIGYAKKISNIFSAGGSLLYKNISIKNYGNSSAFILNAGAILSISNEIGFGASLQNLAQSSIGNESDMLPTIISAGFHLQLVEELLFTLGIEKETRFKPSLRFGTEYTPIEYISLRIGTSNEPNTFSLGIGIHYNYFHFDYARTNNADLGNSHQFAILIRFQND
jgi:hypothetical protein